MTTATGTAAGTATSATMQVTRSILETKMPVSSSVVTATPSVPTMTIDDGSNPTKILNVAELSSSLQHFGYVDYFVFILMLVVCAVIGFYFGFIEKREKKSVMARKDDTERRGSEALDYLVGGRKMKVFPVSLSLVASFVSGISLLGTSTEIYVYGTQYAFTLITLALSGVISWYVFLPVFCNLQLTSTYEYFEMRFDKSIRLFGSILFSISTLIWLPFVIYVPALAFNQVTGINIHIVTPLVCVVCIFYTCVGGLKAVVWTDVIQTVIMVGAIVLVIVKGTMDLGGFSVVWQRNYDSGRIEAPTATWDPLERLSLFSVLCGSLVYYVQTTAGNQVIVQRYLSVPSLKEARLALVGFTAGITLLNAITYYNGMLIFATYYDCDPLSTKLAKAKDQLVPLLVMDILSIFPGMPGLFVAGVFSAALSSLSTGLNSLAAVILEDYIKPLRKTPLTEFQTAVIMRTSVVLIGCLSVSLVFVIEKMGSVVLMLSMGISSVGSGPLLGLFISGLLLPWINSKSAITGGVSSFVIMAWIIMKAQLALINRELVYPEKPVTTIGCTYEFEPLLVTPANTTVIADGDKPFNIYHISFLLYVTLGAVLSITISIASSFIFGRNNPSEMDVKLFSPFIRRFIKPEEYLTVQREDFEEPFEKQKEGLMEKEKHQSSS